MTILVTLILKFMLFSIPSHMLNLPNLLAASLALLLLVGPQPQHHLLDLSTSSTFSATITAFAIGWIFVSLWNSYAEISCPMWRVWKWGLWEVIRLPEWNPYEWDECPQRTPSPLPPCEAHNKRRKLFHPELRRRREGSGISKGRKTIYRKMGRANVCKQMFAMLCRDNGTQRGIWTNRPCWAPSGLPHLAHTLCSYFQW